MANPQVENGYTRIANEIYEALIRSRIPGEARQVLDLVIRNTYGFHKKEKQIATNQIIAATGMSRKAVEKARKNLRAWNLITTHQKGGSQVLIYALNKDYETWQLPPKKLHTTPQKGGELPPKKRVTIYTKDNKENIQKKAEDFFSYFLLKTGRNYRLTSQRQDIIVSRLKDHTIEELKKAVDNFVQDKWPERKKYMDVVYCIGVRNKVDNLERWLNSTPSQKKEEYKLL